MVIVIILPHPGPLQRRGGFCAGGLGLVLRHGGDWLLRTSFDGAQDDSRTRFILALRYGGIGLCVGLGVEYVRWVDAFFGVLLLMFFGMIAAAGFFAVVIPCKDADGYNGG
jgi:hypothetical protein